MTCINEFGYSIIKIKISRKGVVYELYFQKS